MLFFVLEVGCRWPADEDRRAGGEGRGGEKQLGRNAGLSEIRDVLYAGPSQEPKFALSLSPLFYSTTLFYSTLLSSPLLSSPLLSSPLFSSPLPAHDARPTPVATATTSYTCPYDPPSFLPSFPFPSLPSLASPHPTRPRTTGTVKLREGTVNPSEVVENAPLKPQTPSGVKAGSI